MTVSPESSGRTDQDEQPVGSLCALSQVKVKRERLSQKRQLSQVTPGPVRDVEGPGVGDRAPRPPGVQASVLTVTLSAASCPDERAEGAGPGLGPRFCSR